VGVAQSGIYVRFTDLIPLRQVIVSLKEGLFTGANVLFKARFRDGTSIVEVCCPLVYHVSVLADSLTTLRDSEWQIAQKVY
jgi:hypothetical protein